MAEDGAAARAAVRQQLEALRSSSARTRARLLLYVCGGCGMTVLEVFSTRPARAIRTRSVSRSTDRADDRLSRPTGRLSNDHLFVLMPERREDRPDRTPIGTPCKCQQRRVTWGMVWDDLRDGVPKRVLPAGEADDAE